MALMRARVCPIRFFVLSVWLGFFLCFSAQARVYDMYRSDYQKGAFCAVIGGACASDPDLENAFFQNPAALTAGEPDWNFDGDYSNSGNLEPGMKSNNTVTQNDFMGGFGVGAGRVGFGAAVSGSIYNVQSKLSLIDDQGATQTFGVTTTATLFQVNIPVSIRVNQHLSVGIALNGYSYYQSMVSTGNGSRATVSTPDATFRLGVTLGINEMVNKHFRVGSWIRSPVTAYSTLDFTSTAFGNQLNFHEDMALHFPWIWAIGGSYMPSGSREDDTAFLFDLDVIGNTPSGYVLGYDTFSTATQNSGLTPKGHRVVVEPRAGLRTPLSRGKTTLLLGSYYETSRYEGMNGRTHGTGGISYKAYDWIEFMAGADVAKSYLQLFITFR